MSGVWVYMDGAERVVENPIDKGKKVLVHTESNEDVTSYEVLERMLTSLGWERYYDDPDLFQFHKPSSCVDKISLPKEFNEFNSMHMHGIVVKNKNYFHVRDK